MTERVPRTMGLLGGMSWQSSVEYERIINSEVQRLTGGARSADLIVRSYDFGRIEVLQAAGDWHAAGQLLADDAAMLERAGARLIVLCTNTMHKVADAIEAAIKVPFLHLADTTANAVVEAGVDTVALLGTKFTMEHDFYRDRLARHGLDVLVPDEADRTTVHRVIYDELVKGVIRDESRAAYSKVIDRLVGQGATGVIAGCTEIELLVGPDDVACAFFPTTRLHAEAAAAWAVAPAEVTQ